MSSSRAVRSSDLASDETRQAESAQGPETAKVSTEGSRNPGNAAPVIVFLVTRGLMAVLAWLAPHLLTALRINQPVLPRTDPLAAAWSWTSPWFRFDARWYVDVAQHGYRYAAVSQTNTNFFPLYPLLIRLLRPLTQGSPWIAGWLTANLAFLAALIFFWRWAAYRWDRRVAMRGLLLLAAFPFAFFFTAPYSEPLFLALAIASFYYAETDRFTLSLICAGLGTVTRPVGVAVVLALILFWLVRGDRRRAMATCLAFVPFLLFMAYLGLAFGHPLAFDVYHTAGWVRPHGGLLTTIGSQFHTRLSPFDRIDAFLSLLFLVSGIVTWRRLGPAYGLFVLLGVVMPLTRSLAGMERYVIVLFPVFALWASGKSKVGQFALFSISLTGLILATTMFAAGYSLF